MASSKVVNPQNTAAGGIVVVGGIAAERAHASGVRPGVVIAIVVATIVVAVIGFLVARHFSRKK